LSPGNNLSLLHMGGKEGGSDSVCRGDRGAHDQGGKRKSNSFLRHSAQGGRKKLLLPCFPAGVIEKGKKEKAGVNIIS